MDKPHGAIYLEGAFISALNKTSEDSAAYKYFGIEIQISNVGEASTKHLYASTSKDREQWIRALKSATHTKAFQSNLILCSKLVLGDFRKYIAV